VNVAEPLAGSILLTAMCLHCKLSLVEDPRTFTWLHLTTRERVCPGQPSDVVDGAL
jgi:hypothetical protein